MGVGMGRPALNVKLTGVRPTEETRQRIEVVAGPNRMAEFVREAVEAELARREKEMRRRGTGVES